jgi:predicted nucleic-acid-binding protein
MAEVRVAIGGLKQGRGSFADALIAELGGGDGGIHTLTFDNAVLGLPGFELPRS